MEHSGINGGKNSDFQQLILSTADSSREEGSSRPSETEERSNYYNTDMQGNQIRADISLKGFNIVKMRLFFVFLFQNCVRYRYKGEL